MIKIIIFLILVPAIMVGQTNNNSKRNSIFFEFSYIKSYIKINPEFGSRNNNFIVKYNRTVLKKELFRLTIGSGLGIFEESYGEASDLISKVNLSANIKSLIGKNKHLFFTGMEINWNPYYLESKIYVPIGYQFSISPKLSSFVSFSQLLISIDETSKWIWNSSSNMFMINLGIGINF